MSTSELPVIDDGAFVKVAALGEGGFGATFLARDAGGRPVVLKELHERWRETGGVRFAQEARTLAALDHVSVVRVLQLGRWRSSGGLFYVMEHVDGRVFSDLLDATRLDRQLDNLRVLVDVAGALAHAHGRGVVHRDLKPANVIARADGPAVVIDWGLAGRIAVRDEVDVEAEVDPARDDRGELTRGGAGTPCYLSPEQARGAVPDPAMDVYSFGAMLYQLIAGFPPYRDLLGTEQPFIAYRAAALARVPTDVGPLARPQLAALAALAMRCLRKEPERRPRVAELLAELEPMAAQCVCARCDVVSPRAGASRVGAAWVCGRCSLAAAFDAVHDLAGVGAAPVAQPAPAPAARSPIVIAPGVGAGGLDGIVRGRVIETRAGVASIHATDELDRAVVIEEVVDGALPDERARFRDAFAVLGDTDSTAVPRVLRAGATVVVREHVVGATLADHAFDAAGRRAAMPALLALARFVEACHRRGFAHGGLAPEHVVVRSGDATASTERGCDLVAVEWRGIARVAAAADGPWQAGASASPACVRDGRDLVACVARVLSTDTDGRYKELAAARSLPDVIAALEPLVRVVTCHQCQKKIPLDVATLGGTGYTCAACLATLAATPGAGFDLAFTQAEQDDLYRRHRKQFWVWLAAIVALGAALPLIALAGSRSGFRGWLAAAVAALGSCVYHGAQARAFAKQRRLRDAYRRGEIGANVEATLTADEAAAALRSYTRRRRYGIAIAAALPCAAVIYAAAPLIAEAFENPTPAPSPREVARDRRERAREIARETREAMTGGRQPHAIRLSGSDDGTPVTLTMRWLDRVKIARGDEIVALHGVRAIARSGAGDERELDRLEVAALRFALWRDPVFLFGWPEHLAWFEYVRDETVNGVEHAVLRAEPPFLDSPAIEVYVDLDTHRVTRVVSGALVESYADYRIVGGFAIAHTRTTELASNADRLLDSALPRALHVERVEMNPRLRVSDFAVK